MIELVQDIKSLLNIQGGLFIEQAIEDYLSDIDPKDYKDFFRELSGDKFAYKTGMDRVAIVSASFNERKRALLNRNVKTKANALADKLYALKMQVQDKYEHIKYGDIKMNNERYFNNAEMMVIEKLDMNRMMKEIDTMSLQDSVNRINEVMERINQATVEGLALSLNDKKLLK